MIILSDAEKILWSEWTSNIIVALIHAYKGEGDAGEFSLTAASMSDMLILEYRKRK